MKKFGLIPMKLQFFASGGEERAGGSEETEPPVQPQGAPNQAGIDYGKIQQEAEQAIADFKQQKAANTPDVAGLQNQIVQAQTALQQSQINAAAQMAAFGLGIDIKAIPYVLKMADFSEVLGQDGKINDESLQNALNKVLEDIPALKGQTASENGNNVGGFSFGAKGGSGGSQGNNNEDALRKAFGLK